MYIIEKSKDSQESGEPSIPRRDMGHSSLFASRFCVNFRQRLRQQVSDKNASELSMIGRLRD